MSTQRFGIRDILGETSDEDEGNMSEENHKSDAVNTRDYTVTNKDNLKLKLTRKNNEEGENYKKKLQVDKTQEEKRVKVILEQTNNDTVLDLTNKKRQGNEESKKKEVNNQNIDSGKQEEVRRVTNVNRNITPGQLQGEQQTLPRGEKTKNTEQKTVVYKMMTPTGEHYLTNVHTKHLSKNIIPKKISTNTMDNQERKERERQEAIARNYLQQQYQMRAYQASRINQSAAIKQQQQQMLKQQSQQQVTENFRQSMTKTMIKLTPRLKQQAQYIINSLTTATQTATRDNTIEDNEHLKIAMGGKPTMVMQETPVITLDAEPSDIEGAKILMDLKSSANKRKLPATITSSEPKTTDTVPKEKTMEAGMILKHNLVDGDTQSKSKMTTFETKATFVARANEGEHHRELTGFNNPTYLIHNKMINAWVKSKAIIINFKGIVENTIFKEKNENVKEILPFIKRWAPEINKGNKIVLIKNRRILDEDLTWERNDVQTEDHIYVAIATNWKIHRTQEDIPAKSYKLDKTQKLPQPSTSTQSHPGTAQQKRSPNYLIFEMENVPVQEQAKFQESVMIQVSVLQHKKDEKNPYCK